MAMPDRPNLPALTGLRFFLALLIVFEHQSGPEGMLQLSTRPVPTQLASLLQSGYAAVGFFFLLSGFVLAYGYDLAARWTPADRRRFFLARVARIYPVYVLGLALALPFTLVAISRTTAVHAHLRTAPLLLSPLLLQSWLPSAAGVWNGPGWSLSDEAFFYAMFPFLGCLLWRVRGLVWPLVISAGLWLYMLASITGLAHHSTPSLLNTHATTFVDQTRWVEILNFNPFLNLPEFLIGILAAKIFLHLSRSSGALRSGRGSWLYLPAIALETIGLMQAHHIPYVWMHSGLLLPLHAALIIGLALGGGWLPRALSHRMLVLLGQSSYALYLLHGPLKSIWLAASKQWGLPAVGYGWFALYTCLSVAASVGAFVLVEEPMRRSILQRFGTRRTMAQPAQGELPATN